MWPFARGAEPAGQLAMLAAVLEQMAEGVLAVGPAGDVVLVNRSFARLFGVMPSAALGRPVGSVLPEPRLAEMIGDALRNGEPVAGEVETGGSEPRIFAARAAPLGAEAGPEGAVLVLHDVTKLRRLEQVRKEFVANVSHELRTPLASILGFLETLRDGAIEEPANRAEFLEAIETDAARMARLVDDLLELSSLESGRRTPVPEPVDVPALARGVADRLKPLADRRAVRIEVRAAGECQAAIDRRDLDRVFTNLLDNAIKFSRRGGSIVVEAADRHAGVAVAVRDTGIGIPAADLPRVFERFYRVDKARSRDLGGTGLGLAIVKHLLEAQGSAVRVESSEGEGTSFHFELPKALRPVIPL